MRNFPCQTVDNNMEEFLAWGMSKANGCFQIFYWQQHFPITEHHKSENFPYWSIYRFERKINKAFGEIKS